MIISRRHRVHAVCGGVASAAAAGGQGALLPGARVHGAGGGPGRRAEDQAHPAQRERWAACFEVSSN